MAESVVQLKCMCKVNIPATSWQWLSTCTGGFSRSFRIWKPDRSMLTLWECQHDPWGKKGQDSLAARLAAKTPGTDFKIDDNQFYSEVCSPVIGNSRILRRIEQRVLTCYYSTDVDGDISHCAFLRPFHGRIAAGLSEEASWVHWKVGSGPRWSWYTVPAKGTDVLLLFNNARDS